MYDIKTKHIHNFYMQIICQKVGYFGYYFYLAVWRILDDREDVPEGGHVPVLGRQLVHVEALAVQRGVGQVGAGQPVSLEIDM